MAVHDLIAKFEGLAQKDRAKFILAGHGWWRIQDGRVVVPPNTTISFYSRHGFPLGEPPSFDIDRGEFDDHGVIVSRRQGVAEQVQPVEKFSAGQAVYNYTLGTRGRLEAPKRVTREVTGGQAVARKAYDFRFGNNPVDRRFITGDMTLAQIFADPRFRGADLHWSACRVQIP